VSDLFTRLAMRAVGDGARVRPLTRPAFGTPDPFAREDATTLPLSEAVDDVSRRMDVAFAPAEPTRTVTRRQAITDDEGQGDDVPAAGAPVDARETRQSDSVAPAPVGLAVPRATIGVERAVHAAAVHRAEGQPPGITEAAEAEIARPMPARRTPAPPPARANAPGQPVAHTVDPLPVPVRPTASPHTPSPAVFDDLLLHDEPAFPRRREAAEAPVVDTSTSRGSAAAEATAEPAPARNRSPRQTAAVVPAITTAAPPLVPRAEPVVNITIGRIEIRATTPVPASSPRPAPATPRTLTLDDYLAQRTRPTR
jgi:hypothetical protein